MKGRNKTALHQPRHHLVMMWSAHTCSATNSHSSETHCSITLTPLLLPSLSSITGSLCHSSSHLVNPCNTFKSLLRFPCQAPRSAAAPRACLHRPRAKSRAAQRKGSLATRQRWPGLPAPLFIAVLTHSLGPHNHHILLTASYGPSSPHRGVFSPTDLNY